jgi:hypothetical protein
MDWTNRSGAGLSQARLGTLPVVLRLLPHGAAPPARALVLGGDPSVARELRARGYRVTEAAPGATGVPWDLLIECGSFARQDPSTRNQWIATAADLLAPGGHLLGAFLDFRGGGPPYGTERGEILSRFAPRFDVVVLERSAWSDPGTGQPLIEAVFRRRS